MAAVISVRRELILEEARSWIGTPYHHQASAKGIGCDCVGLVRGIWRELTGADPLPSPPAYAADWGEAADNTRILELGRELMLPRPAIDAEPGDVLAMALRSNRRARHVLILGEHGSVVHALNGAGVVEVPFAGSIRSRIVAAFSFPFVE
jgi:NlpC/P60 family putative phage cell wall peptidase